MPFFLKISRCYKGHEFTIFAKPISDDEIDLVWLCEECAIARQAAEKPEASELRGDEAVGSGGDEPSDVVCAEEETRLHHVYELVDGRNNRVFYVGVTMNPVDRHYDHGTPTGNSAALPRITEIRQDGGEYHLQIVASFKDRGKAEAYEAWLISQSEELVNRRRGGVSVSMRPPINLAQFAAGQAEKREAK